MRRVQLVIAVGLVLAVAGCSQSSAGSGTQDELAEVEEETIPVPTRGVELTDINFEFDSSSLDSSARMKLEQNASWLKDNPGERVTIEGHCDERGTAEYNIALGDRRARSVKDYLRSLGVEGSRLDTISYGEELPLNPASSESAWAENRRAHFAVKR